MRGLLRFAFSVSFIALLAFLFIEWKVPGFVSYVFPVYGIVVIVVALGVASAVHPSEQASPRTALLYVIAVIVGIALAEVIARDGSVFAAMQAPLALIALVTPALLVWLITLRLKPRA